MEPWSLLTGALLSVATGVVANYLTRYMDSKHPTDYELRLGGTYCEYVPGSEGRNYTLGQIYFDKTRKIFAFDGTNFRNDGRGYCHFETVVSHVDIHARKFFYVFRAQVDGELDTTYFGFGVVNLQVDGTELRVADGYYVSASVDGRAMSHSMHPTENLVYTRGMVGDAVIAEVDLLRKA